MTNRKTTKRALFTSTLALLMCVAMLIGTTFAWFTDTASTSVNKVQAGTLDVELLDAKGNSLEGQTLTWQKASEGSGQEVLWEPGATYKLQDITIKNNGNLALKYKIVISGIEGDAKLNNAIDWTISNSDGTPVTSGVATIDATASEIVPSPLETEYVLLPNVTNKLTISGQMKEDAGNEYQGLSIDGIAITVYATQYTYEYDSTTNQYDASATLPSVWDSAQQDTEGLTTNTDAESKTVRIENAAQLNAFAAAVKGNNTYFGYTVTLESDIDFNGATWSGIGANNYEKFPSYFFNGTFDGQGHTIYNMTVSSLVGNTSTAGFFNGLGNNAIVKNLNFENASVTSNHQAGVVAGYCCTASGNGVSQDPKACIENCHVNNSTVVSKAHNQTGSGNYDDGDKAGGIIGYTFFGVKDCSVKNTTITGYRDLGGIVGYANADSISTASVTGNTVENVTIYVDKTHDYKNYNDSKDCDANSITGEKAAGVTDSNNTGSAEVKTAYTVTTNDALTGALSKDGALVTLTAGKSYTLPSSSIGKDAVIDGNGAEVEATVSEKLNRISTEGAITFKNVVFKGEGKLWFKGNATFINCTFNGEISNAEPVVGTVTFENCTFNHKVHFAPAGNSADVSGKFFVAKNCTFNGGCSDGSNNCLTVQGFEKVTLTNCRLYGTNWAGKNMISYCPVVVDNCIFTTGIRLSYSDTSKVTCTNCTVDLSWVDGSATVGSN